MSKTPKLQNPPAEFVQERKDLIGRLLSHLSKEQIDWSREILVTKKLFSQCPSAEFWATFTVPFEINSLAVLLGNWGAQYIKKKFNLFIHIQRANKTIEIGDKLGESVETKTRPTSLKDFLK